MSSQHVKYPNIQRSKLIGNRQTRGKVDAVVFGTGTGGTLAGCSIYLKEKSNGAVKAFLADPGIKLQDQIKTYSDATKLILN